VSENEKEHPASIAGRYVRAAGVAIKKERARLAAEGEAKRAAEAAQVAAQPAQPVAPPPQAAPPPPAAVAPPTAEPQKASRRQPGPPPKPNRFLDRLFWIAFLLTILASCLALLNVDMVTSGTSKTVVRLTLGGIFFVVAIALLTNWMQMKDRVLSNVTRRLWGLDHPRTKTGRFMRSAAKDVLTLLGIAWLAIGVFEMLRVVAS
jgi:hypothetical protein